MRRTLVAGCLASSTRQIHSLRANGVMSFQAARAGGLAIRTFSRSAGTFVCTVPAGNLVVIMSIFYINIHITEAHNLKCSMELLAVFIP
jgi:hypothetical protein